MSKPVGIKPPSASTISSNGVPIQEISDMGTVSAAPDGATDYGDGGMLSSGNCTATTYVSRR
jgi:hypothetical protein